MRSLMNYIFVVLFCGLSAIVNSQITIWSENFTYANGTVTGANNNTDNPAADWTTACPTCNRPTEFRVVVSILVCLLFKKFSIN